MFLTEIRKVMQQVDPGTFVNDPEIQNQIDAQDDICLSSLYRIVQSLGGELEIIARLPQKTIRFPQQQKVESQDAA